MFNVLISWRRLASSIAHCYARLKLFACQRSISTALDSYRSATLLICMRVHRNIMLTTDHDFSLKNSAASCQQQIVLTCVSHTAHVIDIGWTSVCPSVRHTMTLCRNGSTKLFPGIPMETPPTGALNAMGRKKLQFPTNSSL